MKKFYSLVVMLMLCVAVNAQENKNYHRVYFGYTPTIWTGGRISEFGNNSRSESDFYDAGTTTTHGFHFGYFFGLNLVKKIPLYLEMGASFQYNNKMRKESFTEKEPVMMPGSFYPTLVDVKYEDKANIDIFQMMLPVQVTYRFKIGDKGFKIAPYLGLTPKFNLLVQGRIKETADGKKVGSETFNFYKDDEELGDGYKPNVFQLAGQVGCNFYFKNFTAGFGVMTDFTPAWSSFTEFNEKNWKDFKGYSYSASYSTTFNLTVGYQF